MNSILLSAGVACVIAAVVGGGLKAFNIEVPIVSSLPRQVLLVVVGLAFLASAWILRERTSGPDDDTIAYRQLAGGTCTRVVAIKNTAFPIEVLDVSATGVRFHKTPLVRELRRRVAAMEAELTALWSHDAPPGLSRQQERAHVRTTTWLEQVRQRIRSLRAKSSDPVSQAAANAFEKDRDAEVRAQANDAMTALAGRNCPVAG